MPKNKELELLKFSNRIGIYDTKNKKRLKNIDGKYLVFGMML